MGPYGRENVKTRLLLQIVAKSFETCPGFPPNGPHKTAFGILKIFEFLIFNEYFFFEFVKI